MINGKERKGKRYMVKRQERIRHREYRKWDRRSKKTERWIGKNIWMEQKFKKKEKRSKLSKEGYQENETKAARNVLEYGKLKGNK